MAVSKIFQKFMNHKNIIIDEITGYKPKYFRLGFDENMEPYAFKPLIIDNPTLKLRVDELREYIPCSDGYFFAGYYQGWEWKDGQAYGDEAGNGHWLEGSWYKKTYAVYLRPNADKTDWEYQLSERNYVHFEWDMPLGCGDSIPYDSNAVSKALHYKVCVTQKDDVMGW